MTAERRLVRVNAANLKHNHLIVTRLRDFFPADAVGGPRRKNANGHGFELIQSGLGVRRKNGPCRLGMPQRAC